MSDYIHSIPGRLRIRSNQLKRDICQAKDLGALLEAMLGVEKTELNKKAGSLVVHYNPKQLTADDILYQAHKAGCLEHFISKARTSPQFVSKAGTILGQAIFGTVVKKSLELSMSSLLKTALR
ncbi:MAG TPA: hypothetical protein EYP59_07015 [Thiotrichaceae bacterium]|nr:hypothetical protein [Thiotrichaceae bacterium]